MTSTVRHPPPSAPVRSPGELAFRRLIARAVDLFTVFFLTFALAVTALFFVMAPLTEVLDVGPWGTALAPTLLFVVVAAVYETVFVAQRGQTPGKDLLGLRITHTADAVDVVPTAVASLARAGLVTMPFLLPHPVLVTLGLVVLAAPVVVGRPGLHDLLTGTHVEAYDADAVEGPIADDSAAGVEARYGPRSWWGALTRDLRS